METSEMPAWLRLIGNFLKTFWWVIVLVLVVVVFVFGGFLKKRKKLDNGKMSESFVKAVVNKVADAVTDVKVEKAIISTKSDMLRKELEKVREESDGKERREKLASILQGSL